MNKRLSKKLHKKYIEDVVYEISLSSLWRKRLFEGIGREYTISVSNFSEIPKYIKYPIGRYKLSYKVFMTNEMLDDNIYYDGGVFFKFEAVKFKEIADFSFNNTGVM
ncbi:hypothetical protein [Acetivibrio cellulolyticus]|uniref:hypothetical protein n=1 Tax=Acetivibrio cellulolyticus TaxID=35830 RepID=UPI0001E2D542|nr:hypothetical protein [Acetivibrio cellulolyticus]